MSDDRWKDKHEAVERPYRRNDPRVTMRTMLAGAGIVLDDPVDDRPSRPQAGEPPPAVDRAVIRALLVARGAPERDLEWMVASCPHELAAMAYRPTIVIERIEDL